ncbi:MAG: alkaline phosphatase family protein [Leptospira sp.]|jgi:alkaline phosphatase D|nr:alkaline phosphatase family protein [Leptospira sp.]
MKSNFLSAQPFFTHDLSRERFLQRRYPLLSVVLLLVFAFQNVHSEPNPKSNSLKILFGSCLHQDRPSPILETITKETADYFFLLGDNIYFDTEKAEEKRFAYIKLDENPFWKVLSEITNIRSTWDDHDYGVNDSGGEYSDKAKSRELFLEYLAKHHPKNISLGNQNKEGIYFSEGIVWKGKSIGFVFLDTRFFRSPLKRTLASYFLGRKYYRENDDPQATILGEEQWVWLKGVLEKKFDLLLLVSSIQVLATGHPFEKWQNFPKERERLFELLENSNAREVLILSGDRHIAEIYQLQLGKKTLTEITSSSLNLPLKHLPLEYSSEFKIGKSFDFENFGRVTLTESDEGVRYLAEILDLNANVVLSISNQKTR